MDLEMSASCGRTSLISDIDRGAGLGDLQWQGCFSSSFIPSLSVKGLLGYYNVKTGGFVIYYKYQQSGFLLEKYVVELDGFVQWSIC